MKRVFIFSKSDCHTGGKFGFRCLGSQPKSRCLYAVLVLYEVLLFPGCTGELVEDLGEAFYSTTASIVLTESSQ